jgi:hypothetical protein
MDLVNIDEKIINLTNVVSSLYIYLVPDWQRTLDAHRLADAMAKKNRKTAKSTAHHVLAGELIVSSKVHQKTWRQKNTSKKLLVPKNTPERMTTAKWTKLRRDVKVSVGSFEEKLLTAVRERAINQLENLNI